ncbi:MAG: glycosyltransferase family 4 protein [Thiogranum sp.]
MNSLLALVAAMAISMVLISIMARFAPRLGLIDKPNNRKIHAVPTPRVGGIGIVVGALVTILFLVPLDNQVQAYVLGAVVLFIFGLWDDISEIGYFPKFLGQLIAVLIVVLYGNIYVVTFPFIPGGEISPSLGVPFTIFAMVGMINAVNLSDGLDGLAGGESLFSLGSIALIAALAEGVSVVVIAFTVIGGILGFLRYNTHPARVFMGDSGSQFLGYTLGFLAILLTQEVDPKLSPSVVLLLLGLPIIDSLVVMAKRAYGRISMFVASRDHLHHRLLDLGFVHQESVIIIYSLQLVFVTSAVFLRYQNDWLILGLYAALCLAAFGSIALARRFNWRLKENRLEEKQGKVFTREIVRKFLVVIPRRFLSIGIPFYLIGSTLIIVKVPHDFAMMSLLVMALMIVDSLFGNDPRSIMRRALIYIIVAFVGFLGARYTPEWLQTTLEPAKTVFFTLTAIAFVAAVKFSPRRRKTEFHTTATDYLVVFCLLGILVVSRGNLWGHEGITFVVQMVVLFYGCELLITEKRGRWGGLSVASLLAVMILSAKGLLLSQ